MRVAYATGDVHNFHGAKYCLGSIGSRFYYLLTFLLLLSVLGKMWRKKQTPFLTSIDGFAFFLSADGSLISLIEIHLFHIFVCKNHVCPSRLSLSLNNKLVDCLLYFLRNGEINF